MFREAAAAGKSPKMELISQKGGSQESLQALNTVGEKETGTENGNVDPRV